MCILGGDDTEFLMEEGDIRVDVGPNIYAVESKEEHGYGWSVRKHYFSPKQILPLSSELLEFPSPTVMGCSGNTELVSHMDSNKGDTELVPDPKGKACMPPQPPGDPIED